jgi:DNA-binding MarR family transcriptional regulator
MYHDRQDEKQVIKTIRLKASDLDAVRQLLGQLLGHFETDRVDIGQDTDGAATPGALLKLAQMMLLARQARAHFFKAPMFGEPAWEMLLALYINHDGGSRQSIGRLSAVSGAPPTTALRWLDYLEKEQLVARNPNPTDRRSDFVELTDRGRSAMEAYLSETLGSVA